MLFRQAHQALVFDPPTSVFGAAVSPSPSSNAGTSLASPSIPSERGTGDGLRSSESVLITARDATAAVVLLTEATDAFAMFTKEGGRGDEAGERGMKVEMGCGIEARNLVRYR